MTANLSTNARRKRKSIVSQKISNMMMKSSDTNKDKSIHTEAFSSGNTTPFSHYTDFVWNDNITPNSTINNSFTVSEDRNLHDQGIQSSNRNPLLELTYRDIDQLNYKNARTRRKVIRNQKIVEKKIHGSTSIGSGMVCTSIEITNGPILHKTNINNKDMVQSDCHNTQPLLDKITNRLDQEFVGSSSILASVDSSSYFEVVNLFDVEDNQSRGNLYY
ncbi:hypothetical protein DEO72_LG4g5 [Vigna unguiculata]|uniref:Uncharacterized protein n=1 Tax=Vigna unguiculata TaxID=3917 RepID=A0A4D6LKG0_VIGUN|nr:hypothetical protein DEO72_LG4g5 [Vigna unguiculata]